MTVMDMEYEYGFDTDVLENIQQELSKRMTLLQQQLKAGSIDKETFKKAMKDYEDKARVRIGREAIIFNLVKVE